MLQHAERAQIGWLWAKTQRSGDGWHPLTLHLAETAQVALLLWERWLPPRVRDNICGANGDLLGRVVASLAGLHDVGKASPAFQVAAPSRLQELAGAGYPVADAEAIRALRGDAPHGLVSGCALRSWLISRGGEPGWSTLLAEIVAGHHGVFPLPPWTRKQVEFPHLFGSGVWQSSREQLLAATLAALKVQPEELVGLRLGQPARLIVAGLVTMADWIASMEEEFPYPSRPDVDAPDAASRAERAWERLRLGSPWQPQTPETDDGLFQERFGWPARPVQSVAAQLARGIDGAVLMVIEAPMGEGKTEAALAAAEILAAATGSGGLFVGLPTQATSNQMYWRVHRWLEGQPGRHTLHLVHGTALRQRAFQELLHAVPTAVGDVPDDQPSVEAAAWFTGRKRGLLAPFAVGTVDQVLMAALRARHVSLRHLGLAGKVVIIDEVHAYDAYMSVFLATALRWLGVHGAPVVLLSATLPSGVRDRLIAAYTGVRPDNQVRGGYPQVTVAAVGGQPQTTPVGGTAMRSTVQVTHRLVLEPDDPELAGLVAEALAEGGSALVIRNTVGRAQATYRLLRDVFPDEVALLHARFCQGDRRRLEEQLLDRFGPGGTRPHRGVLIATQVAEQSLDVDFDLLITDLAPVDLLLQRAGRVHRHASTPRPTRLREPSLVLTGWVDSEQSPPQFPAGSRAVYGHHLLLRSAVLLRTVRSVRLPADVPPLVDAVYNGQPLAAPPAWGEAMAAAEAAHRRLLDRKEAAARQFRLPDPSPRADASLAGLTRYGVGDVLSDDDPRAVGQVRDAPPTLEVLWLTAADTESALLPDGQRIRLDRLPAPEAAEVVLDRVLRLPPTVAVDAVDLPTPAPGWRQHPWLGRLPVVLADPAGTAVVGDRLMRYSTNLGLEDLGVAS